jgi:hypothetical protein
MRRLLELKAKIMLMPSSQNSKAIILLYMGLVVNDYNTMPELYL